MKTKLDELLEKWRDLADDGSFRYDLLQCIEDLESIKTMSDYHDGISNDDDITSEPHPPSAEALAELNKAMKHLAKAQEIVCQRKLLHFSRLVSAAANVVGFLRDELGDRQSNY